MKSLLALVPVLALIPHAGCATGPDACDSEEGCDDSDLMNQAYEDATTDAKADGYDCSGVRVPDRSGFNKHVVLTFDDGPNPATTPKVIEILHRHHAPATFFSNGMRYSAAAKVIANQIAHDPLFMLGNHTQNHINLAQQTAAKVTSEVMQTDALIKAAGSNAKYLRFPFGSASCAAKHYNTNNTNTPTKNNTKTNTTNKPKQNNKTPTNNNTNPNNTTHNMCVSK